MSANGHGERLDLYRVTLAALLLLSLFSVSSWLQSTFDQSDLDRATQIVLGYRPRGGGASLEEAILARHPGAKRGELEARATLSSGCLGHVRVELRLPEDRYAFDVALDGPSIHPTDPKTRELLRSLTSSVAEGGGAQSSMP